MRVEWQILRFKERFLGSQDVRRADLEDEGGEDGRS